MAVFELPTSTTLSFYTFQVELDGVTFKLRFKFNARGNSWYMDVLDPNDNFLRSGMRVNNEYTLLRLWQDVFNKPAGEIIAIPQGVQTKARVVTSVATGLPGSNFTTDQDHGFIVGDAVIHTQFAEATYNGTFVVSSVINATIYNVSDILFVTTEAGNAVVNILPATLNQLGEEVILTYVGDS